MKTALALVLFILGACDAFVVDIAPSKPALLTRILSIRDGPPRRWRGWQNEETKHHGWNHSPAPTTFGQPPEHISDDGSDKYYNSRDHGREVEPQEVSIREQELELQIQELRTKLGRMTARQENTQVFLSLLDVSDNLARSLDAVPAEEKERNDALKGLCEGVIMTENGLEQVFAMSGIVKYGAVGEPFDHNFHHALCEFPDPEKKPDTVGHIIKAGYLLNDQVLRYAEVAVIRSEPSRSKSCELAY
jgi:molecular chaperone GrpE (heat shock protein)